MKRLEIYKRLIDILLASRKGDDVEDQVTTLMDYMWEEMNSLERFEANEYTIERGHE